MTDTDLTVVEEVQTIVRDTIEGIMTTTSMMNEYNHQRAQTIMALILDTVLLRITQQVPMPRKYVVQCLVVQRNGSGVVATNACHWDKGLDGMFTYQHDSKCVTCITTVFGVSL